MYVKCLEKCQAYNCLINSRNSILYEKCPLDGIIRLCRVSGVLELVSTISWEVIVQYFWLCSVMKHWWLKISYIGNIYTTEICKYYKSGLAPPPAPHLPELVVKRWCTSKCLSEKETFISSRWFFGLLDTIKYFSISSHWIRSEAFALSRNVTSYTVFRILD